jgi:hypothetical protein
MIFTQFTGYFFNALSNDGEVSALDGSLERHGTESENEI